MEDLKARYYDVVRKLTTARTPPGQDPQDIPPEYDAEHEKNRKEQMIKLFKRYRNQIFFSTLLTDSYSYNLALRVL